MRDDHRQNGTSTYFGKLNLTCCEMSTDTECIVYKSKDFYVREGVVAQSFELSSVFDNYYRNDDFRNNPLSITFMEWLRSIKQLQIFELPIIV